MGVQSRGNDNGDTILVTHSGEWYVATDESTGVASQGETKEEALANLAEALSLHNQSVPEGTSEDLEESTAPWF